MVSSDASFAFLFTQVGLTGADMGAGYLLPRVVGSGRASELLLIGDPIDAETADRYGLVTRIVAQEDCLPGAMDLATKLAKGPLAALATTKSSIDAEWTMTLESALEHEAQAQKTHLRGEDHREFHASFVEKRPPKFSGEKDGGTGESS